jgi:ribosomal protein S27E
VVLVVVKATCPVCNNFDFVFGQKPKDTVDVICPNCKEKIIITPADLAEVKKRGSDK